MEQTPSAQLNVVTDDRCDTCLWVTIPDQWCLLALLHQSPSPWETPKTCPYVEARESLLAEVKAVPLLPTPLDNEPEAL